ncbi:hypothetical protein GQ53DRAFT_348240 [Thozetella sp. PMI_491]|nr:hypothetical protein GQ53DRAFT_348240 [Thozetella sp. PMI_491]
MEELPLLAVSPPKLIQGQGYVIADMISDVETAFSQLTSEQQLEYLSCHEVDHGDDEEAGKLLRILRSNAYTTRDGRVAIYPKVALINHSCEPNVLNADNNDIRVIVAIRDITMGEEAPFPHARSLRRI